jgi:hypothetical protein
MRAASKIVVPAGTETFLPSIVSSTSELALMQAPVALLRSAARLFRRFFHRKRKRPPGIAAVKYALPLPRGNVSALKRLARAPLAPAHRSKSAATLRRVRQSTRRPRPNLFLRSNPSTFPPISASPRGTGRTCRRIRCGRIAWNSAPYPACSDLPGK